MSSRGADRTLLAKHPDVARQSSSAHAGEGNPSDAPSTTSGESTHLQKATCSASSASKSQADSLPPGGLNSRNRAAMRLSQLERLKASRQTAQACRAAAQKLPSVAACEQHPSEQSLRQPMTDAGQTGAVASKRQQSRQAACHQVAHGAKIGRKSCAMLSRASSSIFLPRNGAKDRHRGASRGYLDRYTAACAARKSVASPPERHELQTQSMQPEEHATAQSGENRRSSAPAPQGSAESATQTCAIHKAQEVDSAAHYSTAEGAQDNRAAHVQQGSMQARPASSQASTASQPAHAADNLISAPESSAAGQSSTDTFDLLVDSADSTQAQSECAPHQKVAQQEPICAQQEMLPSDPVKADASGMAQVEHEEVLSNCAQAPGKAKPLPHADAPVRSPQTQPKGRHGSLASPARHRTSGCEGSPLPAQAKPAGSAGVLFVQPSLESEAVQRIVGTMESQKAVGGRSLPGQQAHSSLQRLVSLHAYAAVSPSRAAAQQPSLIAGIPDAAYARGANEDGLSMPHTSGKEGEPTQQWDEQKRRLDYMANARKQRPRGLAALLAGMCSCFALQPHASPSEPVALTLSLTSSLSPSMPGSGDIRPAALERAETEKEQWSSDSEPAVELRLPARERTASGATAVAPKQESFPTAAHGFPTALMKQESPAESAEESSRFPASLQMPDSIPASLQHQKSTTLVSHSQHQEERSMPASQGSQKLVPFMTSARSLYEQSPSSSAAQAAQIRDQAVQASGDIAHASGNLVHADTASEDCMLYDRVEPALSIGDCNRLTEEQQDGATLQTQTSLAALLQSQGSMQAAPVHSLDKKEVKGEVDKLFLRGSGAGNDLRAFLERQHPGMPSALFDPNAPAPWRSSPSRIQKPLSKRAANMAGASDSGLIDGQGSPLHMPAYLRQGSPALAALANTKSPKSAAFKQAQAWSPARTNIAVVRDTAKHPAGVAIKIACTSAPSQAAKLASQRAASTDKSALSKPKYRQAGQASEQTTPGKHIAAAVASAQSQPRYRQAPKQATPADKRAVSATISKLREVSQAGMAVLKSPQSTIPHAQRQSAVPTQSAVERSGRNPGERALVSADTAKKGCQTDSGMGSPGQQMPHLKAAMMGPGGMRTNALILESGTSMGSTLSLQASRVAMRSIGEAQRDASRDRSRSVASSRTGAMGSGVTALERKVLQQYLSARQLRDMTAAERGVPSPSRRYGSVQLGPHQPGLEGTGQVGHISNDRTRTGLSKSLEAELLALERHWEDLDRETAQDAAPAQPAACGMEEGHGNEEEQLQAQRRVASVIERWESRNISAEALQHMRERASTGRRSWSADGSAAPASSSASSVPQSTKKAMDDNLTHATLDMLEQLSSPAERLPGTESVRPGTGQPGQSSNGVSTDMESICEAKMLPGSLSPLSSAPSSHSLRSGSGRSAETLPFSCNSPLMAAVTAAASPAFSPPPQASFSTGIKPQKLADAFNSAADRLTSSAMPEGLGGTDSSERSLSGAHLG